MTKTFDFIRSLLGIDQENSVPENVVTRGDPIVTTGDVEYEPFDSYKDAALYEDPAVLAEWIQKYDGLLQNADVMSHSGRQVFSEREQLFQQCTAEQISDAIQHIYQKEQEQFGLIDLYRSYQTDEQIIQLQTDAEYSQDISDIESVPSVTYETEEYCLEDNVVCVERDIDLVNGSVTDQVRQHLEDRSRLAYRALDVEPQPDDDDIRDALLMAQGAVEDAGGYPDTFVVDAPYCNGDIKNDARCKIDVSGVMEQPCLVADGGRVGYEIIQQPVTVDARRTYEYRTTIEWRGFFECMNPEMVSGPQ